MVGTRCVITLVPWYTCSEAVTFDPPPPSWLRRCVPRSLLAREAMAPPTKADISSLSDGMKHAREHALLGNYEAS